MMLKFSNKYAGKLKATFISEHSVVTRRVFDCGRDRDESISTQSWRSPRFQFFSVGVYENGLLHLIYAPPPAPPCWGTVEFVRGRGRKSWISYEARPLVFLSYLSLPRCINRSCGRGKGYLIFSRVGRCSQAPQTLTLFKTKIVQFLIPCLTHFAQNYTKFKKFAKKTYPV